MQAIARLKRGGRRSGFAAQSERHGIQHTDGNAPPHTAPMTSMAHSLKIPGRKLICTTAKPTRIPQLVGFSPIASAASAPERN